MHVFVFAAIVIHYAFIENLKISKVDLFCGYSTTLENNQQDKLGPTCFFRMKNIIGLIGKLHWLYVCLNSLKHHHYLACVSASLKTDKRRGDANHSLFVAIQRRSEQELDLLQFIMVLSHAFIHIYISVHAQF